MIKTVPSLGRILTMLVFALSCFGILLFLWLSFGGSVPLQPQGYRVTVGFPEATQLAKEADVRISGVHVGKVKSVEGRTDRTGLTDTVLEIDPRFAPIPRNTRAILRQKTLLGETYVELTPGNPRLGRPARRRHAARAARWGRRSSSTRSCAPSIPRRGASSRSGSTSRAARSRTPARRSTPRWRR